MATVAIFPLEELSVDGEVGFFEELLFVTLESSWRVHEIIGSIELGQILSISIFVDTILLVPLSFFRIVHIVWEHQVKHNNKESWEVQQFKPIVRIEVYGGIPDNIADDIHEERQLEQSQTGLDREEIDVDSIGWTLIDVVFIEPVDGYKHEDLDEGGCGDQHSVEWDGIGEDNIVGIFLCEVELLVLITFVELNLEQFHFSVAADEIIEPLLKLIERNGIRQHRKDAWKCNQALYSAHQPEIAQKVERPNHAQKVVDPQRVYSLRNHHLENQRTSPIRSCLMLLHIWQTLNWIPQHVVNELDSNRHAHRYHQTQQLIGKRINVIFRVFGNLPDFHEQ